MSKFLGSIFKGTNSVYDELLNDLYFTEVSIVRDDYSLLVIFPNKHSIVFWLGSGYEFFSMMNPGLEIPFLYKAKMWDAIHFLMARGGKGIRPIGE